MITSLSRICLFLGLLPLIASALPIVVDPTTPLTGTYAVEWNGSNAESWTATGVAPLTVSGGFLSGTTSNTDAQITRTIPNNNVFRNGIYPIATFGPPPNNINVHNNVFDGIEDITLLALSGVTGFRFVNNTVVVKKDIPVLALGKHGKESRGILIADNLFVKEGGEPLAAEPIVFHADSPPAPDAATVRGNAFWNWKPFGADSRSEDPMLIREPDGDLLLKLSPESPTLRSGKGTPGSRPAE